MSYSICQNCAATVPACLKTPDRKTKALSGIESVAEHSRRGFGLKQLTDTRCELIIKARWLLAWLNQIANPFDLVTDRLEPVADFFDDNASAFNQLATECSRSAIDSRRAILNFVTCPASGSFGCIASSTQSVDGEIFSGFLCMSLNTESAPGYSDGRITIETYASKSSITWPCTSVRRLSIPLWRTVSFR